MLSQIRSTLCDSHVDNLSSRSIATVRERAMFALKQYWYEHTGKKKPKPKKVKAVSDKTALELRWLANWERKKIRDWKRNDRLTDDGTLRLPTNPAPRTTARSIIRAFPNSDISLEEAKAMIG